jgi:hypothetical protein
MRREPSLDRVAAFGGEFVVHIGVEFVLGDGNGGIGHRRDLSEASFDSNWRRTRGVFSPLPLWERGPE